jgi:hypothetical protein
MHPLPVRRLHHHQLGREEEAEGRTWAQVEAGATQPLQLFHLRHRLQERLEGH